MGTKSKTILKVFLLASAIMSSFLLATKVKAQSTSPWDTGDITVHDVSTTVFSNGIHASFAVKVNPPAADINSNGTIENTPNELHAWEYINGNAGAVNASNVWINSQGFRVQIATDASFSTILIDHPVDVTTTLLNTVLSVNIAPPTDVALTPATTYNFRIIGLSPSATATHVLYGQQFTTSAAGSAVLSSTSGGAGATGNQIVGNGNNTTASDLSTDTGLPECSVWGTSKVMGCIGNIFYYILFKPTSILMILSGEIMDWGIGFSIDSKSYPVGGHSFVTDGWRIMRDIANILFIFILVFVAIGTILGQDNKKLIARVILVALIINFSLFLTKIVVDFGNITARFFYNNISVTNTQANNVEIFGTAGHKSISYGFAAIFNPVKLLKNIPGTTTISSAGGTISAGLSDEQYAGFFAVFSIVGAIINLVAAYVFFSLAWLFIARTAGIWLSMVFAPLAFLSLALPSKIDIGGAGKYMNMSSWRSNLFKLAVMPAIALLMIFLVLTFLKGPDLFGVMSDLTTTGMFLSVLIPLIVLSYLLIQTKKTAESMSGEFGEAMGKVGSFVGGAAIGVATGGAALLGRKTIGAAAAMAADSESFKNLASKSRVGQALWQGTKSISNSNFDARNIKIAGKDIGGATGFSVGKVTSKGFIKDQQEKSKRQKTTADSFGPKEQEIEYQKQLENEAKRKEFLMKRGEVDPYTKKIPTPNEVAMAKSAAAKEKERLDSVYTKRRENYAQQVEQGTNVGDYVVNKTSRVINSITSKGKSAKIASDLSDAESKLSALTSIGVGNQDSNGNVVTQTMVDAAQKEVSAVKYRQSQHETGRVGSYANSTAEAIRSTKKQKKKADKDDPQSIVDATIEAIKEMNDQNKNTNPATQPTTPTVPQPTYTQSNTTNTTTPPQPPAASAPSTGPIINPIIVGGGQRAPGPINPANITGVAKPAPAPTPSPTQPTAEAAPSPAPAPNSNPNSFSEPTIS